LTPMPKRTRSCPSSAANSNPLKASPCRL
jgi:hypothetical protein